MVSKNIVKHILLMLMEQPCDPEWITKSSADFLQPFFCGQTQKNNTVRTLEQKSESDLRWLSSSLSLIIACTSTQHKRCWALERHTKYGAWSEVWKREERTRDSISTKLMVEQGLSSTQYFIPVSTRTFWRTSSSKAELEKIYSSVQTVWDHETLLLITTDSSLVAFFF